MRDLKRFCTSNQNPMNLCSWVLAAALWLSAMSGAWAEEGAVPPLQEASDAYVALVQADQARDRSDWKAAAQGYREATQRYTKLNKQYPTWEPDIVQYRVAYCMNQIEVIGQKTGVSNPMPATTEVTAAPVAAAATAATKAPAGDSYRERYLAMLEENQYLRQRMAELQGAADEGGGDAELPAQTNAEVIADGVQDVPVEQELAEVLKENAGLKSRVRELEASAEGASATNPVMESLKGQMDAVRRENVELKKALHDAVSTGGAAPVALMPDATDEFPNLMRAALAQERQGNFPAALHIYERAVALRPAHAEAARAKARCLLQQDRVSEAMGVLQGVLARNPGDNRARLLMGIASCKAGLFSDAAEVLRPVLQTDPSNARTQNAMGAAYMGLGDLQAARVTLEKAVSLDPGLGDAQLNLAQVLAVGPQADRLKAREHYAKAIELGMSADPALQQILNTP